MHSLSEFGANVPAFLAKLWKLVDDPETNELISWTEEGTSFYIRDQAQFSRKLLPMYYKHNNMASFIRQLNMYGFHKIVSADAGSLRLDKDEMEFAHQCFLRGHPYLLEHIKRKVGKSQMFASKPIEDGKDGSSGVVVKAEYMNKILSEVKIMRGRQETVESRLTSMKQENEALWRELSLLRQKHNKQQTIVNKLIQFLVTLVQPSQRLSKRRYPLMINSVAQLTGKNNGKVINTNDSMSRSPTGPTIHELDADSLMPEVESILPESDADTTTNTITLHVPETELAEVIDSSLEPDVMSPNPDVLDSFDSSIIPTSLSISPTLNTIMEVNPEPDVLTEEGLGTNSPSPDLLLAVPPSELIPSVVVPGLRNKSKTTNGVNHQSAAQKIVTRSSGAAVSGSGSSRSVGTGKSAGKSAPSAGKTFSALYRGAARQEVTNEGTAARKELRVLPPRNRKRKHTNGKETTFTLESNPLDASMKQLDLLAEVGLVDPDVSNSSTSGSVTANQNGTNGYHSGCVSSPPPSQLIAFPESPTPLIHSPVSSPSPHCNIQNVATSSLSGPTITDVTGPMAVHPLTDLTSDQPSPETAANENLPSSYNMTLACTSQGSTSPVNSPPMKSSPFNRCEINGKEDLDLHVGSVDNELGQLKEFFNNSGIQLDANTLLGLFSSDDTLLHDGDGSSFSSKMDSTGNELMYYQPDFMDLEEIWNSDNGRSTPPPSPIDALPSEVNTPIMMPASPGLSGAACKRRRH